MRTAAIVALVLVGCGPAARHNVGDDDGLEVDASTRPDAFVVPPRPDATPIPDAVPEKPLVYAHTASTLYSIDPDTLATTLVGDFIWPPSVILDQMTDIAIDKDNMMIGVSFTRVYRVDPATAQTTLLSDLVGQTFNGLSYVPASMVGETGDDVLVATRNLDGAVFRVDPATGASIQIGDMAGGFSSSGDLVAIEGFGTLQTATGATADRLVQLSPSTFTATPIGTDIGFAHIWGVAYANNKVFGFTDTGQFILIDPVTGLGSLVTQSAQAWWGAAVTTVAPVIE